MSKEGLDESFNNTYGQKELFDLCVWAWSFAYSTMNVSVGLIHLVGGRVVPVT